MSHELWTREIVNPAELKRVVKNISNKLNRDKLLFGIKAVAVTGVSGLTVGSIISYNTGLPMIVVRKPNEKTHSDYSVEYSDSIESKNLNYCIIDDLIDSGKTIDNMILRIQKEEEGFKCTKIYLYHPLVRKKERTHKGIKISRCRRSKVS